MGCPRPNTPRSNPYDLGELERPLRDRLWTMFQDAPNHGLTLVSGYRDDGRQWDLRHDRCPGRECDRGCKGHPTTALPGLSKHGKRKAADVGGRDLRWFVANVRRYGLHLPVRGENWHAEVAGTPTVRIIPYPGPAYDGQAPKPKPKDPNEGRTWHTFKAGVTDAQLYKAGWRNDEVSELQLLLRKLGLYSAPVDGAYGPRTVTALIAFKDHASWLDEHGKVDRTSVVTPLLIATLRTLAAAA